MKNKQFKKSIDNVQKLNEESKNLSDFVWFTDDSGEEEELEPGPSNQEVPTFANPFGVTTTKPKILSSQTFFSWLMKSKLPTNKIKIRLK